MAEPLRLVPRPRRVERHRGCHTLSPGTTICLPPGADDADLFAARQLQAEILQVTGLTLRVERQWRPYRGADAITLLRAQRDAAAYPPAELGWQPPPAGSEQAYSLAIGPRGVVVAGGGASGLYYGVQTLRQLVRLRGCELPLLTIDDAPALAERGVLLDVCRGKVPTLDTLKELAEKLSFFKVNQLQLHNEHAYEFPHQPAIGAGGARLSNDEMLALDEHCRRHHVELIPNLQSFGHMRHILSLPQFRHLAETELLWSLAPTVDEGYRLLDDLYADLLPAFSSPEFNVNCDETWDLGQGRSQARMAEVGPARLYLEHVLRVRELVAAYGRRMQMWADIILKHPEVIDSLPADVTLLFWEYEAADTYPAIALLAQHGRRFLVCPGTSSWNTLFPRIDNANANIRTMAREGVAHGAAGLLNTDWGDHGHHQPLGQSWYGYVYGAEQAWSGGTTPDEAFEPAFGQLTFGPEQGEAVVAAMRALAAANHLPGVAMHNASHTVYALFDDPLNGRTIEELPGETLAAMRAAGADAEAVFASAAAGSREALALREMAFSARLVHEAGEKVALSQRIRAGWARIATGQVPHEPALAEMDGWLVALEARWQALLAARAEFLDLWRARAHPQGSEEALGYYRGTLARYDAAAHWLRLQRQALVAGQPFDAKLEAYGTLEQHILWEQPLA